MGINFTYLCSKLVVVDSRRLGFKVLYRWLIMDDSDLDSEMLIISMPATVHLEVEMESDIHKSIAAENSQR